MDRRRKKTITEAGKRIGRLSVFKFPQRRRFEPHGQHHQQGHGAPEDYRRYNAHELGGNAAFKTADLIGGIDEHRVDRRYTSAHIIGCFQLQDGAPHHYTDAIQRAAGQQCDKRKQVKLR